MTNVKERLTANELVVAQKKHIEEVHNKLIKQAENIGEQDGAMDLPQLEDTQVSPNEGLLRNEYQKLIAGGWKKGKFYLDAPHIDYRTQMEKITEFDKEKNTYLDNEKALLQQQRKEKEVTINREMDSKKLEQEAYDKMTKKDYIYLKQHLEEVQNRVGRKSPIIHLKSTFLYVLLLLGIGLSEVPLNIQIFQKFGEAFYITMVMAMSLAIAIPVLAHFSGVFVRQRKEKKEYTTLAIISILLFVVFNFGVSIFRTYVLAQTLGEAPSTLNIVIFTCLNLILFSIGVLASYFRHDESFELENAYKKFGKEKKRYDKEKLGIQNQLKSIETERNNRMNEVQKAYLADVRNLHYVRDTYVQKRDVAMRNYDEILNSFVALESYIDASYRIAIQKYRATNLVNRNTSISPSSWANKVEALDLKFENCKELDPN